MNYAFFGWVNVIILGVLVLPFVLTRFNKVFLKTKNKSFFDFIKFLRTLHKPLGIILVALSFYHGYLALGSIRFHTGTVLFVGILLTVVLGGYFYRMKKAKVLKVHRALSLIVLALLFIHIYFPYAFSNLF